MSGMSLRYHDPDDVLYEKGSGTCTTNRMSLPCPIQRPNLLQIDGAAVRHLPDYIYSAPPSARKNRGSHLAAEHKQTPEIANRKTSLGFKDTIMSLDVPIRETVVEEAVNEHAERDGYDGGAVESGES